MAFTAAAAAVSTSSLRIEGVARIPPWLPSLLRKPFLTMSLPPFPPVWLVPLKKEETLFFIMAVGDRGGRGKRGARGVYAWR
jgi:hypothetical protein